MYDLFTNVWAFASKYRQIFSLSRKKNFHYKAIIMDSLQQIVQIDLGITKNGLVLQPLNKK